MKHLASNSRGSGGIVRCSGGAVATSLHTATSCPRVATSFLHTVTHFLRAVTSSSHAVTATLHTVTSRHGTETLCCHTVQAFHHTVEGWRRLNYAKFFQQRKNTSFPTSKRGNNGINPWLFKRRFFSRRHALKMVAKSPRKSHPNPDFPFTGKFQHNVGVKERGFRPWCGQIFHCAKNKWSAGWPKHSA